MDTPVEERAEPKNMSLSGYEVLLKAHKSDCPNILSQMDYSDDAIILGREFRVLNENQTELRNWVKSLMAACLVAHNDF